MRLGLLLVLSLPLAAPTTADAGVLNGSVTDPAEGGAADIARAEVRYDDAAGALELIVALHRPPPAAEPPTVSWLLSAARAPSGACDLASETLGVEATFATGEATVRLPDERRVPARVEVVGTTARIVARDPVLAGLPMGCAQLLSATGDETPGFALAPGGPAPDTATATSPPGALPPGDDAIPGPTYRLGTAAVTTRRLTPRTVEVNARVTICGPTGLLLGTTRYRLARGTALTKPATAQFARWQQRRCQRHRLVWRVRVASTARYDVRATLAVSPLLPTAGRASRGRGPHRA